VNTLVKQQQAADKGWAYCKKISVLQNVTQGLQSSGGLL